MQQRTPDATLLYNNTTEHSAAHSISSSLAFPITSICCDIYRYLEGDEEEGVENEDEEGADGDGEADDKSVSLGGEDESPNAGDEDDA